MKNPLVKILVILIIFNHFHTGTFGQDISYVRKQLYRLCSPEFHGRGYYKKGDSIAAAYLAEKFREAGLNTYGTSYFQNYTFNVNDLTEVSISLNGEELEFDKDYMINPGSSSFSGSVQPVVIDQHVMKNSSLTLSKLITNDQNEIVILDSLGLNNPELYSFIKTMALSGITGARAVIEVLPRVPGGRVGRRLLPAAYFQVKREAIPDEVSEARIRVSNNYYENYPTRNVIGYIPGKTDEVVVFTAHYDMLGSFGEGNFFPGASDNGSGTAMVLDLVRHFSSGKKPHYTIAFMLFSGEEAGLMGSSHYADNPLFPLEKIKLVINLDMVGTGQNGVILFNGPKRPREASIVQKINREKNYMIEVEERESKANSDHYPFQAKGVPAIFFLTKGPSGGGHNTNDTPEHLPLYGYENLFRLILDTLDELERQEVAGSR